jgi:hypothetical protein
MKIKLVAAIFLAIFANACLAGGSTALIPVTSFHYYKGHVGLLINQASMTNPDKCARGEWYILPTDHPNYNEMVALIMVSHMKGHPLSFYVEGCVQSMPAIVNVVSNK